MLEKQISLHAMRWELDIFALSLIDKLKNEEMIIEQHCKNL
jgi:hypothetical protein